MEIKLNLDNVEMSNGEVIQKLCKNLYMEEALDTEREFCVREVDGELKVFEKSGELRDDRGELFVLIRSLICQMFANIEYRGDDYIIFK